MSDTQLVQAEQARNTLLGLLDGDIKKLIVAIQALGFLQPSLRIMGSVNGVVPDGALNSSTLFNVAMKTGDSLTTALSAGWLLVSSATATANATFTLLKNGVSIGTSTISAGQTHGVWTFATTTTFSDYDRLSFTPPTPPDATVANVAWTIIGLRTQ